MPSAEFHKKTLFDAEPLALTSEVVRLVGVFAATILKLHMIPDQSSTRNLSKPHLISAVCLKTWMFSAFTAKVGCSQQTYCVVEVDGHLSETCQLCLMCLSPAYNKPLF